MALSSLFGGKKVSRGFDDAIRVSREMFDTSRADLSPYRDLGTNYMGRINEFMSRPKLTGETLRETPGYQFRMDEGLRALENSALARGGLNSGNTMKAIMQYGQDYATGEYDKALARDDSEFAKIKSLLDMGYGAASGSANQALGFGNAMSNLYTQKGQAEAQMKQFPWMLGAKGAGMALTGGF